MIIGTTRIIAFHLINFRESFFEEPKETELQSSLLSDLHGGCVPEAHKIRV